MPRALKIVVLATLAAVAPVSGIPAGAVAAETSGCKIAVLGDSLAAGFGVVASEAFPVRLAGALRERGYPCEVLDAGVSGDTSAGGRSRVEWVLADRPSHLLVELGGNDALRALPVEQLESNLDAIVRTAKDAGVPVMLAGMLAPPNLGAAYGRAFAAVYPRLSERHGIPLVPFFLEGVAGEAKLMQPDGIHPNAQGVDAIVRRILPTVERWLRDTGVEPGPPP